MSWKFVRERAEGRTASEGRVLPPRRCRRCWGELGRAALLVAGEAACSSARRSGAERFDRWTLVWLGRGTEEQQGLHKKASGRRRASSSRGHLDELGHLLPCRSSC